MMSDHVERSCTFCGSLMHQEDDCAKKREFAAPVTPTLPTIPMSDNAKRLFGTLNQTYTNLLTIAQVFGFDGPDLEDSFLEFMQAEARDLFRLRAEHAKGDP